MEQKFCTVLGKYRMAYNFYASPSKDTIVFIHGIPTNSHLWDQVIPYFNEKYNVIALDLIGYGDSDRAPYYDLTLPKQAEYIIDLLDQIRIEQCHFVGHDLGGGIVQILSVYYSNRVKSIVIADGVCFSNWPIPKVFSIRWPVAPEFVPSPLFIERMLREGVYHPKVITPYLIHQFTKPFMGPTGPIELQQASLALDHRQTEHLVPYLPNMKIPVKVLWGQHDPFLPPYWANLLKDTIPNSSLTLLKESSHYSMLDNPSLFSNEILNFLQL
jgi:2-hydroxymuconate-semialdehyde hydrolase